MKQLVKALAYGFIFTLSAQIQAEEVDIKAGKFAFETCTGCHSVYKYSNVYPTYYVPKIGGQRKEYIVSALLAYKNQLRPRTSMLANANGLTEKTVDSIALYVENSVGKKKSASSTVGNPVKGEELAQACLGCHTTDLEDGALAPILAGQYENYLIKVMHDYQTGQRQDPFMQSMVADFSEEELADIAAYFAVQKGLSIVKK